MGTLTSRAERALLGALLLDPGLVPKTAYVEPGDFELTRHRLLHTAITQAARSWDATEPWPAAVAAAAGDGTTLWELDELCAACPDPAHGRSYAALVLEAHFQRTMRELAGDAGALTETISYDAARLTRARSPGSDAAAGIAGHADRIATAIGRHAAGFSPGTACAPAGPPAIAGDGQARDEELILGALISGHPRSPQILAVLGPAAFTDPLRRSLFRAVRAADAAGRAIDPLTVDWELARAGTWRVPADDDGTHSYATRLAGAAPAGEITQALRDLERHQPSRAPGAASSRRDGPAPRPPSPQAMTARQPSADGPRLLQPPPDIPGSGQAPGPRR